MKRGKSPDYYVLVKMKGEKVMRQEKLWYCDFCEARGSQEWVEKHEIECKKISAEKAAALARRLEREEKDILRAVEAGKRNEALRLLVSQGLMEEARMIAHYVMIETIGFSLTDDRYDGCRDRMIAALVSPKEVFGAGVFPWEPKWVSCAHVMLDVLYWSEVLRERHWKEALKRPGPEFNADLRKLGDEMRSRDLYMRIEYDSSVWPLDDPTSAGNIFQLIIRPFGVPSDLVVFQYDLRKELKERVAVVDREVVGGLIPFNPFRIRFIM